MDAAAKVGDAGGGKPVSMDSDKDKLAPVSSRNPRSGVLVGRNVTIRTGGPQPEYFTDIHRRYIGKKGCVHAVVASMPRENPLVKVGFENGSEIVFFRRSELDIEDEATPEPRKHGKRGSHLPPG